MDTTPLLDRAELVELADRYLRSLDDRRFDETWAEAMFTEDARTRTPRRNPEGRAAIIASTRSAIGTFERTQHVGTNHLIEVSGDRATLRWNVIMTHVHDTVTRTARGLPDGSRLTVGGTVDAEAERTADGWRFAGLVFAVVWTDGELPVLDGR